jgi:hypothetical protein
MVRFVSSTYLSAAFTSAIFIGCTTNNETSVSDAFSMNLFDRFARVTKSNVNTIINRFESPEKIMTQAVVDMQVRNSCSGLQLIMLYTLYNLPPYPNDIFESHSVSVFGLD